MTPQTQLQRICSFLNIDFEKGMLDFTNHEHHITNGNDMRFSTDSRIVADFAWKNKLSDKDLFYFNRVAGKMNVKLGYQ